MARVIVKGITCPRHPDERLRVLVVRKPEPGVVVRYRTCPVKGCTYRVPTEERIRAKRQTHRHSG